MNLSVIMSFQKLLQCTALLIFLVFLFFACDSSITGPEGPSGELPRELTVGEKLLVEADQSFSYDIFRRTVAYDSEVGNIMISPLSISMALSMTLNGARGETFEDMRQTLYLSGMDLDEINEAFQSLIGLLISADPKVTLKIANSIWYREGLDISAEFVDKMDEYFNAQIEGLDFSNPASVDIINTWVNENTEELIDEILEEIPANVVMYLINALYFKGDWLRQFDVDDTKPADFYLESGETVQADMMSQKGLFATYFSNEVQMIELPYGDSLFAMTLLMPADPDTPVDLFIEEKLNATNLSEWRSGLWVDSPGKTQILLPKFELEYELTYNDILKAMGMEIAFGGSADLSGLVESETAGLYIDEVKHKTFIRVDEEGTEAAAVTSVAVFESASPQFIANRPFVFIIYERESGTNLFMGKVKNPVN